MSHLVHNEPMKLAANRLLAAAKANLCRVHTAREAFLQFRV
jgi:hypothetical protein